MTDKFRLDIRPSDIDVDHANWLIDRQSARIQELAAERDALKVAIGNAVELADAGMLDEAADTLRTILEGETDDQ